VSEPQLAHRFQRLVPLHQDDRLRLDLARDVAADRLGTLLTTLGSSGPNVEILVRTRLRAFAPGRLFRDLSPQVVLASDEGLHFLLPPIEAHPWENQLLAVEGRVAVEDLECIVAGLEEHLGLGCPAGALQLDRLYRDETGPFFLPHAYALAPSGSLDFHDPSLCLQEVRSFRDDLASLGRRYLKMVGSRLGEAERSAVEAVLQRLHEEEAEAPTQRRLRSLMDTLESLRKEGGALIVRTDAATRASAEAAVRDWARTSERRYAVCRPHVCAPLRRMRRGDEESGGAVLVLRDFQSYPPFSDSLQSLRNSRWIDGREILVVLSSARPEGEAARLFSRGLSRPGESTPLEISIVPGQEAPLPVDSSEGLPLRILEALQVAQRPLCAPLLAAAFAASPEELASCAVELQARGSVELLYGIADEGGADAQLLLALPAQRCVELNRDRVSELRVLLASALEGLPARASKGKAWLRLEAVMETDPPRASAAARHLLQLNERNKDALLDYAVHERLLNSSDEARPRLEDRLLAALSMGVRHREAGELDQAQEIFQEGLDALAVDESQQGKRLVPLAAELTLELGHIARDRNRHSESHRIIREALDRFEEDLPALQRGHLYLDLSWAQLKTGRTREAAGYCELVLKILDAEKHPHEVSRAYNQLGLVQYEESNYSQSLMNLQRALVLREQAGDAMGVARSYNNLSLTYRSLGRLAEAERCLRRSLEVKIKAGDTPGMAITQLNLGLLAIDQGQYEKARRFAVECLHVARRYKHRQMEAEAHGLLGEAAMGEGRHEEARDHLLRDLEICRASNNETERLATLRRFVGLLLKLGEVPEAERRLGEAQELLAIVPSRYEASMLGTFESEILRQKGELEAARRVLSEAARNFGGMRRFDLQLDCLARRADLEWEMGRANDARASLLEARDMVSRHEIHRVPELFHDLEGRLGELPRSGILPAVDHRIEVLADLLAPGGEIEAGRPEGVLRAVAALLGASEVHWERAPRHRALSLIRTEILPDAIPAELADLLTQSKAERATMSFRSGSWTGVRVRGVDVGWLCVRRERPVDDGEHAFLNTVAGILSLAGGSSPPAVEEESWPDEDEGHPGAAYGIIGNGAEIQAVLRMIEMVRDNDVTILILGENGTGKDLVARAIHGSGSRKSRELVAVNCASIPPTLLESELFGHEKGAFTSAVDRRIGIFERADGGSVFLDEIAEMPLTMQAKLLRVLQDKSFTRVGGSKTIHSDVRVIAATNRDLSLEVEEGRFRMDLFYRLNVISISLPPLRERKEDIRALVHHFVRNFADEFRRPVRGITDEAIERLMEYDWPGNIRELENVIKKAIVFAGRERLRVEDLPRLGAGAARARGRASLGDSVRGLVEGQDFSEERPLMPRVELTLAWEVVRAVGNKTKAAKLLGITKPTLYSRLRRYAALTGESAPGLEDRRGA
jgi:DNA-binding NtrC family response regulator/tetratricopeptide (TPR) repeat protein